MSAMRVIGVDGCPQGWITATVDFTHNSAGIPVVTDIHFDVHSHLATVLADESAAVIGIDIPIGLPGESGTRLCDVEARKILRPFGSRVFPAPARVALPFVDDYTRACEVSRHECGRALSRQTWNILGKIAETDELADDLRIVEVHPEVSFTYMNGEVIAERKKTAAGRQHRLKAAYRWLPQVFHIPRGDDAVDALACAWTAMRITAGSAVTLPSDPPPLDALGRPMRIVA